MTNKHFVPSDNTKNMRVITSEEIPALEDDTITIKNKLDTADQSKFQGHILEYENKASTRGEVQRMRAAGQNPVKVNYKPDTAYLLYLAVIDWSFMDDETGVKIPITLDIMQTMDVAISSPLEDIINQGNPTT